MQNVDPSNVVAYEKRSHYMVDRETRVVIRRYIETDHKTV